MRQPLTVGPKIVYGDREIGEVAIGGHAYVHIDLKWYASQQYPASLVYDLFHDLSDILQAVRDAGYEFSQAFEERERQYVDRYTIPDMMRNVYVAEWKRMYGSNSWPPDLQQFL